MAPRLQALDIRSDGHPAYERSSRRLAGYMIFHKATPSTDPRTPANDLFFVNRRDMMLRHNGANHRRETIAFSKRDRWRDRPSSNPPDARGTTGRRAR